MIKGIILEMNTNLATLATQMKGKYEYTINPQSILYLSL